jgi:hypothetical protein
MPTKRIRAAGAATAGSIAATDLAALALTGAQMADQAVTPGKLYDGAVGLADPLGLAAIIAASPVLLTPTFSRAGAAYDPRNARAFPYRPWLESIITPSPPDTEELVSEDKHPSGTVSNISVQCATTVGGKTYLIARLGYGVVYRKTPTLNSGKWTAMTSPASIEMLSYIWSLSNGDLIAYSQQYTSTQLDAKLWRSTDAGDTWTQVFTMAYDRLPGSDNWSLNEGKPGTVLFTEYGDFVTGKTKRVHRSADYGATWTTVLTLDFGHHFHGSGYHKATGRWVLSHGDGTQRRIYLSDDDGLTWVDARTIWPAYQINGAPMPDSQPNMSATCIVDTGHPTCMWHCDGVDQSGRLNMLTGELTDTITRPLHTYSGDGWMSEPWDMRCIGGVLYHTHVLTWKPADGFYYPAVVACPNPNDDEPQWVIVAQHSTTYGATKKLAGIYNGKLHWYGDLVAGSAAFHGQRTAPTFTRHSAVMLAPAATNLLDSAIKSSFEGATTGWTVSNGTFVAVTAENGVAPPSGAYMGKLTETTTSCLLSSPAITVATDDVVVFEIWLRQLDQQGNANLEILKDGSVATDLNQVSARSGGWQHRRIMRKVPVGDNGSSYALRIMLWNDYAGQVCYFDCAAIWKNGIPIPWHPGGAARPADALSYAAHLAASWTLLFQFNPDFTSFQLDKLAAGTKLYLLSIVNGATEMELYYDPGDAKRFNLYLTDGVDEDTIYLPSSGSYDFHPRCPVWVAIRYDADPEVAAPKLSVALRGKTHGGESIEGVDMSDLSDDDATIKYGDSAGANGLPGLLSNVKLYPALLTDDEINAEWGAID